MSLVTSARPIVIPEFTFFGVAKLPAEIFCEILRWSSLDCLALSRWIRPRAIDTLIYDTRLGTREARFRLFAAIRHGLLPFVRSLVRFPKIGLWADLAICACRHGQLEALKFLMTIEGIVDPKLATQPHGWATVAIESDQANIVEFLFGAHPQLTTDTSLVGIAKHDCAVKSLRFLACYHKLRLSEIEGEILFKAANADKLKVVERLVLEHGIRSSHLLNTSLTQAAESGSRSVVEFLLTQSNVDLQNRGRKVLEHAARRDWASVIQTLLSFPFDWELGAYSPSHPLAIAINCSHRESAEVLVSDQRIRRVLKYSPEFVTAAYVRASESVRFGVPYAKLDILELVTPYSYPAGSERYESLMRFVEHHRLAAMSTSISVATQLGRNALSGASPLSYWRSGE